MTTLDQIMDRVLISEDTQCWVWGGSKGGDGYGYVNWHGKTRKLTRLIYELKKGPIPKGLQLDHLCRRPICINPHHLEPVTSRENTMRGKNFSAYKARQTHCIHGHEFDKANTYYDSKGNRSCRTCHREYQAARHHRTKVLSPKSSWTRCAKGHEYSPENTGLNIYGNRFCRTCRNEWQRASRARKREVRH